MSKEYIEQELQERQHITEEKLELGKKWHEAIEAVRENNIVIFNTRKIPEDDPFSKYLRVSTPNRDRCPVCNELIFQDSDGCPNRHDVIQDIEDFDLSNEDVFETFETHERTCPICEQIIHFDHFLARNLGQTKGLKDKKSNYWRKLWESKHLRFFCCRCYDCIHDLTLLEEYRKKPREVRIENLRRFGIIE